MQSGYINSGLVVNDTLPKVFYTVEFVEHGTHHRHEGGFGSESLAQAYAARQKAKGSRIIGITSHVENR